MNTTSQSPLSVASFKSRSQLRLFDEPISGHGFARYVIGDFVEELTAHFLQGQRHSTASKYTYCPDVSKCIHGRRIYVESKAAGLSRQTFVYEGRLKKDEEFARHHQLFYMVWHHRAATKLATTVNELRALILHTMQCAYFVPFADIRRLMLQHKLEKLNSKYGHAIDNARLYGAGYRLKIKLLEPYKILEWRNVYGTRSQKTIW